MGKTLRGQARKPRRKGGKAAQAGQQKEGRGSVANRGAGYRV
jgi:hypothetical protein